VVVATASVAVALVAATAFGAIVLGDDEPGGTSAAPSTTTTPVVPVSVVDTGEPEQVPTGDQEKGTRSGSPLDDLPEGVTLLSDIGQRPDWSPDGEHVAFLDDSPIGDVWTVEVATGERRNITEHFEHLGFARAYYLANGDLLLCGPTSGPTPSAEQPEAGRFTGVMSVLRAPFDGTPERLGVPCWEGIATAGDSMRIAWNRSDIDYTDPNLADRVVNGITEIWVGDITDVDGGAALVGARKVLDRDSFGSLAVLEVQDFRPPDEDELLFTAYAYQGGEVFGIDLVTGEVRNYSNSTAYEEVEGIATDGRSTYVERDTDQEGLTPGALDIWRLGLENASWERITYFNRWAPYYASNPTASPDGSTLAFQLSLDGDTEGQGEGILLMEVGEGTT
jgi:hypothetical protein